MFLLQSCDKSEIKAPVAKNDGNPLSWRSPCDLCMGNDDCCCYIELGNDNSATLQMCGASQGGSACTGSSICGASPNGGGFSFTLTTTAPRFPLCVLEGNPIWIQNVSLSDKADIYITCQSGQATPQLVHIQLNPGQRVYYETDGICLLYPC